MAKLSFGMDFILSSSCTSESKMDTKPELMGRMSSPSPSGSQGSLSPSGSPSPPVSPPASPPSSPPFYPHMPAFLLNPLSALPPPQVHLEEAQIGQEAKDSVHHPAVEQVGEEVPGEDLPQHRREGGVRSQLEHHG